MAESSINTRISPEALVDNVESLNEGEQKIEILKQGILIKHLKVMHGDVSEYVRSLPKEAREEQIIQAVKVGVFCLERASAGQNLDFVKREVDGLFNKVQESLAKIPADTEKALRDKLGTDDGQVLAPIKQLVKEVSRAANDKIENIRTLLQDEVDPTKETSSLGKALKELHDLLDPKRTDSIQGSLNAAINRVSAVDGSLAEAIKQVVKSTLQPLEDKVDDLSKEVRGKAAAAEAIEQTTLKGAPYEEEIVRTLQVWAKGLGAEIHHLGPDKRPGDVLIVIPKVNEKEVVLRIVVEGKDRQDSAGRKPIGDSLDSAMSERNSNFAIYVSKTRGGLAKEIGEWAEGTGEQGRWIACTHEHLITAVRFLITEVRLSQIRSKVPTVDAEKIENQIVRIRTTLGRLKTINTKVTNIKDSANDIQNEAEHIRVEIKSSLTEIEDALQVVEITIEE